MKNITSVQELQALFVRYQGSPLLFVQEIIRPEHISNQQKEFLEEVGILSRAKINVGFVEGWKKRNGWGYDPRSGTIIEGKPIPETFTLTEEEIRYGNKRGVSVMSGKGVGKDTTTAWLILWFLCCFPNCKIPVLGPRIDHIKTVLFSEIRKWWAKIDDNGEYCFLLKDWIKFQTSRIFNTMRPKDEVSPDTWACFPLPSGQNLSEDQRKELFAGLHADDMLAVVDEACNVDDVMFNSLEGTCTDPHNWILMIFNPTREAGYAVRTHTSHLKEQWVTLQFNAEESDRVSPQHLKMMEEKFGGRDTNGYRVNVLGLPPYGSDSSLIPWNWVYRSLNRDIEIPEKAPVVMGVDVAGSGADMNAIVCRRGMCVERVERFDHTDVSNTVNRVLETVYHYDAGEHKIDAICVDTGGPGGPTAELLRDRLREEGIRVKVVRVEFGSSAINKRRYYRFRDEIWWRARTLFENNELRIDPNIGNNEFVENFIEELSRLRYEINTQGLVKVETKHHLRHRLGQAASPDMGDALVLTFARNDIAYTHGEASKREKPDKFRRIAARMRKATRTKRNWMSL